MVNTLKEICGKILAKWNDVKKELPIKIPQQINEQLLLILIHLIQMGEDIVRFNILWGVGSDFTQFLQKEKSQKIIEYLKKGYTHNEISKILRCSPSANSEG